MKQKLLKKRNILSAVALLFLLSSCIDGYKDDYTWVSSVRDAQLESPDASTITCGFSADGTSQIVRWPVVPGAGGYLVSIFNIDDPENHFPIVENQIVDGLSITCESTEDCRFKVVIKTLGNAKFNNKEALTATEKEYTNLLPVTAVIPNGMDITQFFTAVSIKELEARIRVLLEERAAHIADSLGIELEPVGDIELCFELEAGGTYTMNGSIFQEAVSVTIRGDKVNPPTLSVQAGSFVNGGAGLKLKFIDFDYSNFGGAANSGLITMHNPFNPGGLPLTTGGQSIDFLVISENKPIAIQSCNFKEMKTPVFSHPSTSMKYAIGNFLVKDCVIGFNSDAFSLPLFYSNGGNNSTTTIKDLTIINSTIYNEQKTSSSSNYLIQIHGEAAARISPLTEIWAGGTINLINCTFYQWGYGSQSFNNNGRGWKQSTDKIITNKCVIVNSFGHNKSATIVGGDGFGRRLRACPNVSFSSNSYWYDGEFASGQVASNGDNTNTQIDTDPELTYLGNGEFSMTGAAQIAVRAGDPRWLPE